MLTGIAGAVTGVGGAEVAVVRAGRPRRLDAGRAGGASPRAGVAEVAVVDRCVARRARIPGRMRAGGGTRAAVARVGGADVAIIRAGCPRRLDGGRAGGARPSARVVEIALVGRRVARRARVAREMLAERVADGAVASVGGADVAVIRAGRPRRLDGGRAGGTRPRP